MTSQRTHVRPEAVAPSWQGQGNQPQSTVDVSRQELPGNHSFKPIGCSTLRPHTPDRSSPEAMGMDATDHNFDSLKSKSMGADGANFQGAYSSSDVATNSDIAKRGRLSANNYLKEYQAKYGKLGIFREDDLYEAESRTLCFPFFKDSSRRQQSPNPDSQGDPVSSSGDRRFSAMSLASSWDPSMSERPLRASAWTQSDQSVDISSAGVRGSGEFSCASLGRSAGRDWQCTVFGSPSPSPIPAIDGKLSKSSEELRACDTPVDSSSLLQAQTALKELESIYSRKCRETQIEGSLTPVRNTSQELERDGVRHREMTSHPGAARADFLTDRKLEASIPVINISDDYETNDRTQKRGSRSRSGRRTVSDLGFRSKEPSLVPTPRTAALLSNPAFRKHLAKNMGVSEENLNEEDFQYDFKLNLPHTSPTTPKSDIEVSPASKLAAIGLRERLLRTSVSDSSLQPPSCLNSSSGASSNDSSFNSLEKTISESHDSLASQSEMRDSFTSPPSALNLGFTAMDSLSEPNSPNYNETSPLMGKTKFHIPSFKEFRQHRSPGRHEHPLSPAHRDSASFDFMSQNPIQEEAEMETDDTDNAQRARNQLQGQQGPDTHAVVDALSSDLVVREGQWRVSREGKRDEQVIVYDPVLEKGSQEGVEGEGHCRPASKHRGSERKAKRSHRSEARSRSKCLSSGDLDHVTSHDLGFEGHQDGRGEHRKEPERRPATESDQQSKGHTESQRQGHSEGSQKDAMFDGHQEVKVIKEFKIRDSSKGHSSDSKIMVVMIRDEANTDKIEGPKCSDKLTERPPRPERRKKKDDVRKDETYIVHETKSPSIERLETVESSEREPRRESSRSRSSNRSSSRSKKEHKSTGLGDGQSQQNDDLQLDREVLASQPGDGHESKTKFESGLRRSSRRSSRRRFLPKSEAVEEMANQEVSLVTSGPGLHLPEQRSNPQSRDSSPSPRILPQGEEKTENLPTSAVTQFEQLSISENVTVTRSVSDISDKKAEEQRRKGCRERRQKLYKSDPFTRQGARETQEARETKNPRIRKELVRSRSPRDEIMTYLTDGRKPVTAGSTTSVDSYYDDISSEPDSSVTSLTPLTSPQFCRRSPNYSLYPPLSPLRGRKCRSEDGPSGAEVERVDSGVGAELKDGSSSKEFKGGPICEDCEGDLTPENMSSESDFLCKKCEARRVERKEIIQEIADTEVSYGKDLKIIKEEFYLPMQSAGLLSPEQLEMVFSNMEELITINDRFSDQLLDGLELANDQGDEDYNTVQIGRMFLEASNMLLAFETYCVNQASVPAMLEKLEEEKELLRIFLQVSQTENSLLRRMNLKSFLMVPVQRVMKYPLLLSRLYKATSPHHEDRESIRKAQNRVEDILEHINSQSRGGNNATMRLRRKISGLSVIKKTGSADDIEINKMAIELLGWNRKDVNFVMSGRLQFTQPTDHLWMKRGRSLKFIPAYALLLTLGRSTGERWTGRLLFSKPSGIQDAALVLIKEKAGKFVPLREPLKLERCVVSVDTEFDEVFEIMDSNKESFLFKGEDRKDTMTWLHHLKLQTKDLGSWRKRRNALPNIMIHSSKT